MASMYPGMAAQEATKERFGLSTFRTIPVTEYRSTAAARHAVASASKSVLLRTGPSQADGMPLDLAVIVGELLDLDGPILGGTGKSLRLWVPRPLNLQP